MLTNTTMKVFRHILFWCGVMLLSLAAAAAADDYAQARQQLLELIQQDVRDTSLYLDKEALDPRVMATIGKVPRHRFVPAAQRHKAYLNRPLPIGYGQTISQPYIVALMTAELFAEGARNKVLEIGTGCGYQAAVLASFASQVYSIERIEKLYRQARDRLYDLRIRNVKCLHADGFEGLPDEAPFDGILAAAASGNIPGALLDQLAPNGRLVMPVDTGRAQTLIVVDNTPDGFVKREVEAVKFVPRVSGTS